MMAAHAVPAARQRTAACILPILALVLSLVACAAPAARAANPDTTRLTVGAEERVRTENWDNTIDFNSAEVKGDTRHQVRLRTRAWARLGFAHDEFAVGLLNESRRLSTPRIALQMDEVVFETLYWDHRFTQGVSLRVGRQNITKGDGFLIQDGSPGDGSRSAYFNAADLAWTIGKGRLDLLAIVDPYRDRYLPRIHDRNKALIEWDERAVGVYWSGPGSTRKSTLDAYWLYKTETGDPRTPSSRQGDRFVHTLGARVARELGGGWSYRAEAAGQAGSQQKSTDILAWGSQLGLTRAFATRCKPQLTLGAVALTGDDPATPNRNEAWDPLFSRYPRWSEGYIYTLQTERGVAYWTNLAIYQFEARASLVKKVDVRATYQRFEAEFPYPGKPATYGTGTVRGDLYIARADVKWNDSWRGHVVGEYLVPGDFYSRDDAGWFFRAEAIYTFSHVLAFTGETRPGAERSAAMK